MRKGIRVAVLLALFVAAAPAFAGFGIHVNLDQHDFNGVETFTLPGDAGQASGPQAVSSIERANASTPLGIGVDLTVNILPIVDFQFSVEMAATKYDVVFNPAPYTSQPSESWTGVPFLRAGADASVMVNVFKFPPVASLARVYVGGGLTVATMAPVPSQQLLEDNNIDSADQTFDIKDFVKADINIGYHALVGVGIKPPAFPLGFRVYAKYYMMPGLEAPALDKWVTLSAGIFIGG